jgi:hypothetical protein
MTARRTRNSVSLPFELKEKGGGANRELIASEDLERGRTIPLKYNHVFRRLAACEPSHRLDLAAHQPPAGSPIAVISSSKILNPGP